MTPHVQDKMDTEGSGEGSGATTPTTTGSPTPKVNGNGKWQLASNPWKDLKNAKLRNQRHLTAIRDTFENVTELWMKQVPISVTETSFSD